MRHTGGKKTAGGLSKIDLFYRRFNRIRCRITEPNNKDYKRYGGRGLTFEWDGYISFKKDMYPSYLEHVKKYGDKNTTFERIDNSKGYSKDNCRWATFNEQAKNRRTNRYITYKGRTMIIADWARELNTSRQSIRYRLENGWDAKSIIETPIDYTNRYEKKTIRTSTKVHR